MKNYRITIAMVLSIVIVTLLSLIQLSEFKLPEIDSEKFINADKIIHVLFYFTINFMVLAFCLERFFIKKLITMLIISLGVILYGCIIELIQLQIGRECSIYDVIANSCGTILALYTFRLPFVTQFVMKVANKS